VSISNHLLAKLFVLSCAETTKLFMMIIIQNPIRLNNIVNFLMASATLMQQLKQFHNQIYRFRKS
jgi:two-component SAPR family response regulator